MGAVAGSPPPARPRRPGLANDSQPLRASRRPVAPGSRATDPDPNVRHHPGCDGPAGCAQPPEDRRAAEGAEEHRKQGETKSRLDAQRLYRLRRVRAVRGEVSDTSARMIAAVRSLSRASSGTGCPFPSSTAVEVGRKPCSTPMSRSHGNANVRPCLRQGSTRNRLSETERRPTLDGPPRKSSRTQSGAGT
jgi:hypothetical protein